MKKIIMLFCLSLISIVGFSQTKPIEIISPYSPGGTATNLAHLAAEILTENNIPTTVINKPGADSVIGVNYVAKSPPNGQTLLLGAGSTLAGNIVFGATGIEYNENTFVPLVPLGTSGWTLFITNNSPIKNYEQFKFYVKANPDKFTLGAWNANYAKLLYAWAKQEGLPEPTIVYYKGTSQAITDVIGGHLFASIADLNASAEFYKGKKINIIATFDKTTNNRVISYQGNKDVVDITKTHPNLVLRSWWGLYAPAGTPADVVEKINTTINKALKTSKYQDKIKIYPIQDIGGAPEQLLKWQQRDLKLLRSVIDKN